MTIESAVAALTESTTALTTAVGVQQLAVSSAVGNFSATTSRVNDLNNVNNTADADKPVSIATAAAIALKQSALVSGLNISTVNGKSLLDGLPLVIDRSATSLSRVTYGDRGTLRALTPQIDDSSVIEGLGLFVWVNTQLEPDDDETSFNTATGQWLLQIPSMDLISVWNTVNEEVLLDKLETIMLLLGIPS